MALIHEAIGEVVCDPTGQFETGARVVMIPNTPVESDPIIAENYLRSSKFRASGFDGFMQEYVSMDPDRLVRLPEGINPVVAAFTEIVSVSYHVLSRFERFSHQRRETIGVWGDGNLGYITSLLLKNRFPDTKVYVFGINELKLHDFSFVDGIFLVNEIPEDLAIDHAFECVGGGGCQPAINQIIDLINPEGAISLMGVSENNVGINTRMVLEKGLRLFGSSRSGVEDFAKSVELYSKYPKLVNYLDNLVGDVVRVESIPDIHRAFDLDYHRSFGKTVIDWAK
jgi:ribitol-5-phosphate 2-dehydrogenase